MKIIFFLTIIILFLSSCRKTNLVPEITPALVERKIELKDEKEISDRLFQYNSIILFIRSKNKITRFNPQTGHMDSLFNLKYDVENDFFIQNNRLILKKANSSEILIYNLKKNTVEKIMNTGDKTKIIGIDRDFMIFQKENQMVILQYKSDKIAQIIDLADEVIHNCSFNEETAYIFSSKKLYWYIYKTNQIYSHVLQNEAVSGFLLWDDHIYYGSKNRELVKLSLKQNKIRWKIKLAMNLILKPEKIGRYLVITPEDNNIYFYQKNASLYWWEKCNGTRLSPPIIMRENVALFLLNKKIKFFNFKTKTVQDCNLKAPVLSNPVYFQDYIYFISRISRKKRKPYPVIQKVGNQYQVKIKTDPEFIKPLGQSIQFNLTPINLIKPEIDIKIIDSLQESVFSKTIHKNEALSFVWLPEKEGKYKLMMEINTLNIKSLKVEKNFKIIDLGKIIKQFNIKTMEQCSYDFLD